MGSLLTQFLRHGYSIVILALLVTSLTYYPVLVLVCLIISFQFHLETESASIHSKMKEVMHGLKPYELTCTFKRPHGGAVALQQRHRTASQRK